jgi:hypothetical protein
MIARLANLSIPLLRWTLGLVGMAHRNTGTTEVHYDRT